MSWDERIARARRLAADEAPARTVLTFYADLAEFQQSLQPPSHGMARGVRRGPGGSGRAAPAELSPPLTLDVDLAATEVRRLLGWLRQHAPAQLAHAAAERDSVPLDRWRDLMRQRAAGDDLESADGDATTAFVVEALLQPFAEIEARRMREAGVTLRLLRSRDAHPRASPELADVRRSAGGASDTASASRCPMCGGPPVAGALREEGHGARRTLICALCLTEWDYLRVRCPGCEENRFDALPVYTADTVGHVRIDACDTCRTYMKTVDLTKDGLAVPVVDDLATVPLDLWAREHGYRRLYPNLLRL